MGLWLFGSGQLQTNTVVAHLQEHASKDVCKRSTYTLNKACALPPLKTQPSSPSVP
jgi:hypothetical protein